MKYQQNLKTSLNYNQNGNFVNANKNCWNKNRNWTSLEVRYSTRKLESPPNTPSPTVGTPTAKATTDTAESPPHARRSPSDIAATWPTRRKLEFKKRADPKMLMLMLMEMLKKLFFNCYI